MVLQEVVVVGASLAGIRAAEALRAGGFAGSLTLVGAESHAPYDRPPLSKKVLAGEQELDRIALQRDGGAELDLTWCLGTAARALDLDHRLVVLEDDRELRFDGLVVATGAAPRRLHLLDGVPGVHVVRTLDDSLALRAELTTGEVRRVVVVGAGFIGSEVAATARGMGHEVVVLEALPVPLARGLGHVMGPVVAGLHADHGVELRLEVVVEAPVLAHDGRIAGLQLAGGEVVAADVVVVGIGVVPVTGWLEGSGLTVRDGLVCDPTLRAGADGVVAAGDVVRWTDAATGLEHRAEHWTNAAEQGAHAAATLLAGVEATPFSTVPFVWSDQYDARIQVLGLPGPDDEVEVVRGSIEDRRFVALYHRDGRFTAALGLTMARYLMPYRMLLERGASFDEAMAVARA